MRRPLFRTPTARCRLHHGHPTRATMLMEKVHIVSSFSWRPDGRSGETFRTSGFQHAGLSHCSPSPSRGDGDDDADGDDDSDDDDVGPVLQTGDPSIVL
ncbi:unnamed protein product [Heligmosomoides polygyrus]|uniref:Uncharacterized protein n=1 Tax=Heligmosomoides polygyrus TaxID=6339 RepID=A0A183FU36_HELPZ|nr:unnamed protein product [Heligmosomoides polygyrus]